VAATVRNIDVSALPFAAAAVRSRSPQPLAHKGDSRDSCSTTLGTSNVTIAGVLPSMLPITDWHHDPHAPAPAFHMQAGLHNGMQDAPAMHPASSWPLGEGDVPALHQGQGTEPDAQPPHQFAGSDVNNVEPGGSPQLGAGCANANFQGDSVPGCSSFAQLSAAVHSHTAAALPSQPSLGLPNVNAAPQLPLGPGGNAWAPPSAGLPGSMENMGDEQHNAFGSSTRLMQSRSATPHPPSHHTSLQRAGSAHNSLHAMTHEHGQANLVPFQVQPTNMQQPVQSQEQQQQQPSPQGQQQQQQQKQQHQQQQQLQAFHQQPLQQQSQRDSPRLMCEPQATYEISMGQSQQQSQQPQQQQGPWPNSASMPTFDALGSGVPSQSHFNTSMAGLAHGHMDSSRQPERQNMQALASQHMPDSMHVAQSGGLPFPVDPQLERESYQRPVSVEWQPLQGSGLQLHVLWQGKMHSGMLAAGALESHVLASCLWVFQVAALAHLPAYKGLAL
jgi:hypothetical protein